MDLGGVDGLLHITDMAWKRIKHPGEIVEVGEEIDVKVLKFDRERNRVSLNSQLGGSLGCDYQKVSEGESNSQGHEPHRLRCLPRLKRV